MKNMKMWQNIFIATFIRFTITDSGQSTYDDQYKKKFGKIIHVSAIFRHGDRSPFKSYPSDPHVNYPWPDGHGQLLTAGKKRLYHLGKWYKYRYSELAKTIHSHTNITVWSSNTDRTIMSAQCFLAGFYPPVKSQYLDERLQWQPVPVHTIPRERDNIIAIRTKDWCAAKLYYANKFYNRKKTKRTYDKYLETFNCLRNHTGYNFSRDDVLESVSKVDILYDILFVQEENNLTLPLWTKKVFPRPMFTILEDLLHVPPSLKLKRLLTGPLLKSVISNMIGKCENNSTKMFHFYAGHDGTIATVASALNFQTEAVPPYGSGVIFELRKKEKQHFVTVFYANSTTKAPYFLSTPKCGSRCTLKEFIRATDHLIPKNWDAECEMKKKT